MYLLLFFAIYKPNRRYNRIKNIVGKINFFIKAHGLSKQYKIQFDLFNFIVMWNNHN